MLKVIELEEFGESGVIYIRRYKYFVWLRSGSVFGRGGNGNILLFYERVIKIKVLGNKDYLRK